MDNRYQDRTADDGDRPFRTSRTARDVPPVDWKVLEDGNVVPYVPGEYDEPMAPASCLPSDTLVPEPVLDRIATALEVLADEARRRQEARASVVDDGRTLTLRGDLAVAMRHFMRWVMDGTP